MGKNKKILILRFGALGDIVHTTIIPQAIKLTYPNYEIHYCCESRYAEVLKNHPDIDKIIEFDHTKKKNLFYNFNIALNLRAEKYDIIFNLTNALRNNFMVYVANPKTKFSKVKMKHKHVIEAFFLTAKAAFPKLTQPKNLNLGVDPVALEKMKHEPRNYHHPLVILSPGGQTDKNRQGRAWEPKNWIELGNLLNQIFNATIIITGSPNEKIFHKKIADKINNSVLYSGKLSLAESMALFSLADLFISGDSGPLHIASGLGVKTIGLFGSTHPENVKPYGDNGFCVNTLYDCKFCWQKKCTKLKEGEKYTPCMRSIKPAHVLNIINNQKLIG